MKACKSCGAEFTDEQSSGAVCFRCKLQNVGFTWRGPTRASKQNFHDLTIREAVQQSFDAEKRAGTHETSDFIGKRWV